MVSTRLLTSKSSRAFNNPLVTVSKAPITISTIVTFMFQSFFSSLAMSRYLFFFSHSFSFILWSTGTQIAYSPWVSRTLLCILSVLNNAWVLVVSTRPPTSKSPSPFNKPLVTVPKAPIMIGTIVTFMFHSFFQFPSKVGTLILLFTYFQFNTVVSWDSKVNDFANFLFSVDYYKVWSSGRN